MVLDPNSPHRDHRVYLKRLRAERGDSPFEEAMQALVTRKVKLNGAAKSKPQPKPAKKSFGSKVTGFAKRVFSPGK